MQLSAAELDSVIADVDRHWSLPEQETFLKRLDESYAPWRKVKNEGGGKKGKNKKSEE